MVPMEVSWALTKSCQINPLVSKLMSSSKSTQWESSIRQASLMDSSHKNGNEYDLNLAKNNFHVRHFENQLSFCVPQQAFVFRRERLRFPVGLRLDRTQRLRVRHRVQALVQLGVHQMQLDQGFGDPLDQAIPEIQKLGPCFLRQGLVGIEFQDLLEVGDALIDFCLDFRFGFRLERECRKWSKCERTVQKAAAISFPDLGQRRSSMRNSKFWSFRKLFFSAS